MMQQAYTSTDLKYLLYIPESYDPQAAEKWPLILFLHGSGERGDDPQKIKKYCLPRELEKQPNFPFLVLSPLCPANTRWLDIADSVMHLLDEIVKTYSVDPRRIDLSGFSMGGEGVWFLAVQHPDRFAAVAPISGPIPPLPDFLEKLCALNNLPFWVFHGTADEFVPIENSRTLVQKLRDCGGDVQFTVYESFRHGQTSDTTYADSKLFNWFLTKGR